MKETRPATEPRAPQSRVREEVAKILGDVPLADLDNNSQKFIELIDKAKEIGSACAAGRGVSKTQIMNFMGEVRRLGKEPDAGKVYLLQAYLAYAVGKDKERKLQMVKDALDPLFSQMKQERDKDRQRKAFATFVHFIESIVAFYQYNAKE
jgi:CRISPR type III-A-associated protein Csm2